MRKRFAIPLAPAFAFAFAFAPPVAAQQPAPPPERAEAESVVVFWEAVQDTTLERLMAQALASNHDLRAAEARLRGVRASRTESALDLVPAITATGGYTRQRLASATMPGFAPTSDQDVWDAGLQLTWEVDAFGRLRKSLQGESALVGSAEADVRDVQVLLAAEVARTYFDLRGAQSRLGVARRNAANQRRTLELTEDRLALGRGSALDRELAQSQLSTTLASVPALEAEISTIEHQLAVLLARTPGSLLPELGDTAVLPALPLSVAQAGAEARIRQRPDVRSAEHRLVAARAFTGVARADYLPRISLGAVAGYTASRFDALGDGGTRRFLFGPVVSWPLLDLGRVKLRVAEARAGEVEAAAHYEQSLLRARAEAEGAVTGFERARERLVHLEEAAAASERATDLARLRFEEGITDFLEVLDAERRLLESQDRLAAGRTDAQRWLVAVYRALGGSVTAPPR